MSTSPDFGSEREQREWEAQERALREELRGTERHAGDPQVNQYRLLVRALRNPPLDPIPDDFAARTAAGAEDRGLEDDRLEMRLQSGLLMLLAAVGVWTMVEFGAPWLPALAMPESPARPLASWSAAILACLALSSLFERWSRRRENDDAAT